MIKRRYIHWL